MTWNNSADRRLGARKDCEGILHIRAPINQFCACSLGSRAADRMRQGSWSVPGC